MLSFFNLSRKERKLLLECLWLVYKWKILLWIKSFKSLSENSKSVNGNTSVSNDDLQLIKITFYRINRVSFWKNKCLVNTFAARAMLNKRNISSVAYLGLIRETSTNELSAHAWISVNTMEIIPNEKQFKEVYRF